MTSLVIMSIQVSVAEAKANLSDLLRQAEAGDEVIVSRNGRPVAKICALRPREPGFFQGQVVVHDPNWWQDDSLAELFEPGDG